MNLWYKIRIMGGLSVPFGMALYSFIILLPLWMAPVCAVVYVVATVPVFRLVSTLIDREKK